MRARARRASTKTSGLHDRESLDLAAIYDRHAPFVWRTARRLGVPAASLDDVVHDVFVIVHRRLGDYDGRAALTTWLYGITRGVVRNAKRGRAREARRIERVQPQPAPLPATDDAAKRAQAAAFVRRFLETLDPTKAEVFALVDLEGNPVKDVAVMLGLNINTAHARLRAARRAFTDAVAAFQKPGARRDG